MLTAHHFVGLTMCPLVQMTFRNTSNWRKRCIAVKINFHILSVSHTLQKIGRLTKAISLTYWLSWKFQSSYCIDYDLSSAMQEYKKNIIWPLSRVGNSLCHYILKFVLNKQTVTVRRKIWINQSTKLTIKSEQSTLITEKQIWLVSDDN